MLVLAMALTACGGEFSSPARPADVTSRTALALFTAYADNEIQADNVYKGLWIKVDGTIDDIGKDVLDTPYITFHVGTNAVWGVQALFERGTGEAVVGSLKKGQYLTVICQVDGKLLNVILTKCEKA